MTLDMPHATPLAAPSPADATPVPAEGMTGAAPSAAAQAARTAPRTPREHSPALLENIHQLMLLRSIAACGQTAAITYAAWLDVAMPLTGMLVVITLLVVLNVATWARLATNQPATHREIFAQLLVDLAALTALLVATGGVDNPFSLLYLLHVVLMAVLLPLPLALSGALLVFAAFTVSHGFAEPLLLADGGPLPRDVILLGQWISFVLTAAAIVWFVVRIVEALREHERRLREAEQKAANDDALLRIGALAAGAVHELATPLTTMAVLINEMQHEPGSAAHLHDVETLSSQIDVCRQTLRNLMAVAGHASDEGHGHEPIDRFLDSIAGTMRKMRPRLHLACQWDGPRPVPEIHDEPTLKQAILILLNNAADASPDDVRMTGQWSRDQLVIAVLDCGKGMPDLGREKIGRMFFTTKAPGQGTGLGLVLTVSTVSRLGGTVEWSNRPEGGVCAEIRLPLGGLTTRAPS